MALMWTLFKFTHQRLLSSPVNILIHSHPSQASALLPSPVSNGITSRHILKIVVHFRFNHEHFFQHLYWIDISQAPWSNQPIGTHWLIAEAPFEASLASESPSFEPLLFFPQRSNSTLSYKVASWKSSMPWTSNDKSWWWNQGKSLTWANQLSTSTSLVINIHCPN